MIRFVSGRQYLNDAETKFQWVMPPFVAVGSSMMLWGRQGLGKSSLAKQLVHSLGTGEPWLGFPIEKTGKSLYLALDMAEAEERRLLERCEESGLCVADHIILPRPAHGEEVLHFNILDPAHKEHLKELCQKERPVAVFVDAIQDSYETPVGWTDINELIRKVLFSYREAVGDAVLVFLNHKRKGIIDLKTKQEIEDEDSFMGGTAWEAKVAASVQLFVRDNKKHIRLNKTRLDKPVGKIFQLDDYGVGFYKMKENSKQMLMLWPHCIVDREERAYLMETCKSQAAVFRAIASKSGENAESVKKAFQRAQSDGVEFKWAEAFKSE